MSAKSEWRECLLRAVGVLPLVLLVVATVLAASVGLRLAPGTAERATASVRSARQSPPQASAPVRPVERDRELQLLLDRRAAAVLAHDERSWLADVEPSADRFRAAQRVQFRGLARVPFADFGYQVIPGRGYTLDEAVRRWGPQTYVAAVLASHRLRGFDSGSTVEPVALTFTYRAGRWWLVADSDADALLPATGHSAPWDLTEVAVARRPHVLVVGEATEQAELRSVATRIEAAIRAVRRVWPVGQHRWDGRVVVYAVHDPRAVTGYLDPTADAAARPVAIAVPALDAVSWFDPLSSAPGVVGTRVIVDRDLSAADDDVLRHEIAHVASLDLRAGAAPTWMVEGVADYTAYRPASLGQLLDDVGVDDDSADALDDGRFALELPFSVRFYDDAATVDQHYVSSLLACTYVRDRWGEATLLRLHARLARDVDPLDEPDTQDAVLRSVLGMSTQAFERAAGRAVQAAWDG